MQEVEEMISTSTRKILLAIVLLLFVSTATAQFQYSDSGYSTNDYFSVPEYDSQEEIATQFVAPFIFISVLLHFALSRALSFILANGEDDPVNDPRVLWGLPRGTYTTQEDRVDVSKYSMIMSIAITASLIPTPYWGIITGIMGSIGILTGLALLVLFLYGFYNVARALT